MAHKERLSAGGDYIGMKMVDVSPCTAQTMNRRIAGEGFTFQIPSNEFH
jgi:hypothetical protein